MTKETQNTELNTNKALHIGAVSGNYWKILDCNGIEMPDDWTITPRTYERVKRLLDRLNVNGEQRPYTMVEK